MTLTEAQRAQLAEAIDSDRTESRASSVRSRPPGLAHRSVGDNRLEAVRIPWRRIRPAHVVCGRVMIAAVDRIETEGIAVP